MFFQEKGDEIGYVMFTIQNCLSLHYCVMCDRKKKKFQYRVSRFNLIETYSVTQKKIFKQFDERIEEGR